MATPFAVIRARAADRKGGDDVLTSLLPAVPSRTDLAALPDDRILAEMTKRVFCSGFVWMVIEAKWAGFEEAFLGFHPKRLAFQPDEFWGELATDKRIIRNGQKIMAVRNNAKFINDIAAEYGGFGRFLADWPATDQLGLMDVLAKRGSRLGALTGQYFLRFIGWDGWVLSKDVVAALRDAGLDIAEMPTARRDLMKIQAQFNAWAAETGLPFPHLSRICALSIGENRPVEQLRNMLGE